MKKGVWDRIRTFGAPDTLKTGRKDLRSRNKWLLLHLIQSGGPKSQAELARLSGLSPASVSGILQPLIEAEILVEERKATSGLGRKASILGFNPRVVLSVGISIDQEVSEVALVDPSGRVIDQVFTTYPRYTQPTQVVVQSAACVLHLMERQQVSPRAAVGVGVAIPGLVDSTSGLVSVASNLGWRNIELQALFEQKLQLPVRVEHLGRAKARSEGVWGAGANCRNFVCLEIGSGIGAGVIVDGSVLHGAADSAGEVGHMPMDPSGPRCACGLNGCWEVFCAGAAIPRRLAERLAAADASGGSLGPAATLAQIESAALEGHAIASQVIDEAAEYLARGLVSIIWSFDPEIIILSGPVVRDCPSLIQATRARLHSVIAARSFDIPLVSARQEAYAGVIAASAIVSLPYVEQLSRAEATSETAGPDARLPSSALSVR
jgi:predicted NBD/HSP70 family sugar kinase